MWVLSIQCVVRRTTNTSSNTVSRGSYLMKNSNIEKPTLLASFLGSIIMIIDGLSMVFFGLIYLVGAANADFFYDMGKKEVVLHLGQIVAVLTLVYLISCIISLVYWLKGRPFWKYV